MFAVYVGIGALSLTGMALLLGGSTRRTSVHASAPGSHCGGAIQAVA